MNVMTMLSMGAQKCGDPLYLNFGYPEEMNLGAHHIKALKKLGVKVRPFKAKVIPGILLNNYYDSFIQLNENSRADEYLIFCDGISNFEESDLWLILSDHVYHPLPPHKKYGMVIYDLQSKNTTLKSWMTGNGKFFPNGADSDTFCRICHHYHSTDLSRCHQLCRRQTSTSSSIFYGLFFILHRNFQRSPRRTTRPNLIFSGQLFYRFMKITSIS